MITSPHFNCFIVILAIIIIININSNIDIINNVNINININNNNSLISSFLEIDFEINISDKKSRRFDLSEVIFKCIKVL